ncbi:thioredoxin family protein [Silvibacterium sp.]|uniref:thioredoxin family protein n=1 Tax=Silvibacterium sp. TaxID=1964179 RepID=UPI0039E30BBB
MLSAMFLKARRKGMIAAAMVLAAAPLPLSASSADAGTSTSAILSQAESQAHAEHKNILVDFSASWCGNCRLYDRFLADPQMRPILSRAFVFVTLDTGEREGDPKHANTPGGVDFESSIGGKNEGFPWLVMLDADGKPIVSSDRPDPRAKSGKDNIGYPVAPEEVDWFVEMLRRAAPQLNPQDLASVHEWLTARAAPLLHH